MAIGDGLRGGDVLQSLDIDELAQRFVANEQETEARYRVQGRLFFWCCIRLGVSATAYGGRRGGVYALLMQAGATKDGCRHASIAAKVYARVQAGEVTEAEYNRFSYHEMKAIAAGDAPARPRHRRRRLKPKADAPEPIVLPPVQSEPVEEPEPQRPESEIAPFPPISGKITEGERLARIGEILEIVQAGLLEVRAILIPRFPDTWNDLITGSLTPLGRLRFEAGERAIAIAKTPPSLLGLPEIDEP